MKIPLTALQQRERYKKIFRTILFSVWATLFVAGIIGTTFFLHRHGLHVAVEQFQIFLHLHRELLLISLLGVYLIRTIIFIPVSLLGAFTGIVLGQQPFFALTFAVVATTLSALCSFGIARALGREWVTEHETPRLKAFDKKVRERGFFTIFLLRILIVVPFDLINLASGFSAIRFRDFALASFLGIIPEVAVQIFLGNSVNRLFFLKGTFLEPKLFLFLGLIILAIYLVGRFLKKSPHFREMWSGTDEEPKK